MGSESCFADWLGRELDRLQLVDEWGGPVTLAATKPMVCQKKNSLRVAVYCRRGGGSYAHPFLGLHADVMVCVPGDSDWLHLK